MGTTIMAIRFREFLLLLGVALGLALTAADLRADSREHIDTKSVEALERLRVHSADAGRLAESAAGVLVFPDVVKMGFGVGGQYGEGSLLVQGEPVAYYATAGASFGLQVGAEYKSEVILFMTEASLQEFRNSHGWEVGIDGAVVMADVGSEGKLDSLTAKQPVVGFIFSNHGLMGSLSFEGSKFMRIAR